MWENCENYRVSPQDEEIIFAKIENLKLITNAIDEINYLPNKQLVLIAEPFENFDLSFDKRQNNNNTFQLK